MYCDFHTHTSFSSDSKASPESMIQRAIELEMHRICITDHEDIDFPEQYGLPFVFDYNEYFTHLKRLQRRYADQIDVLIGVELGLQPHLGKILTEYVDSHKFDFIIGSTHLVDRKDTYYPEMFAGRSEREVLLCYFEELLLNIKTFHDFDVIGHIDYIARYTPSKGSLYNCHDFDDIIDDILKFAIENGIGIECNTARLGYELLHCNPHEDIIKRYRQLGGEIITLGSDAHTPETIGNKFKNAGKLLKASGFKYYTVFRNRKPQFLPL